MIQKPPLDRERIMSAVNELFLAIGEDPGREGLLETPRRIADMYAEIFGGLHLDPSQFHGEAHVGYVPDGRVVGISKLARVVEAFARRPQIQEQLTSQVAEAIMETLQPDGVAVVIEAEHLCMTMRGVKKPGSRMITSAMRGEFRQSSVTRAEFLSLVHGHH